jgi:universal stress protein E
MKNARALAGIVAMDLYVGCSYAEAIKREHLPLRSHQSEVTAADLGEHFGLNEARVMLRQGRVVKSLQAICDELKPSIVVMGTLARSGVRGKLIGNTAEKLLDVIDADLLTVY